VQNKAPPQAHHALCTRAMSTSCRSPQARCALRTHATSTSHHRVSWAEQAHERVPLRMHTRCASMPAHARTHLSPGDGAGRPGQAHERTPLRMRERAPAVLVRVLHLLCLVHVGGRAPAAQQPYMHARGVASKTSAYMFTQTRKCTYTCTRVHARAHAHTFTTSDEDLDSSGLATRDVLGHDDVTGLSPCWWTE